MNFTTTQWISWLGATLAAAVALMGGAYATFETAGHAQQSKEDLTQRMDRLEQGMNQRFDRLEGLVIQRTSN